MVRVRVIVRVMLEDSIQCIAFKNTLVFTVFNFSIRVPPTLHWFVSEANRPVVSRMSVIRYVLHAGSDRCADTLMSYVQVEPGLVLLPPADKHRRQPNLSVPHLLLSATPAQRIHLSESFQVLRDVERRVSSTLTPGRTSVEICCRLVPPAHQSCSASSVWHCIHPFFSAGLMSAFERTFK